ncbi:hypothetical protein ACH5A2_29245 [Streptomyces collinus]
MSHRNALLTQAGRPGRSGRVRTVRATRADPAPRTVPAAQAPRGAPAA